MESYAFIGIEGLTLIALIAVLLYCTRLLARNASLSRELAQTIETLRHAEKLGRIGTWKIDVKADTLHWSDRVFAIHGRDIAKGEPDLGDAIGYYVEADRARVQAAVDRAITRGDPFEFTASLDAEDGTVKNVLARGMCSTNVDGKVDRIDGVFIETASVIQLAESVNDNNGMRHPDKRG